MKDNNIYIDFEAIAFPFNQDTKLKRDFPYAYSLGVFIGDEFKTKTFIFDFNKFDPKDIDNILRRQIVQDVKELKKDRLVRINPKTTQFISYSPTLEKRILSKVYKGVKVKDISEGLRISIASATKQYIDKDKYFQYLKEYVSRNVDQDFIENRGLESDGALAAIAGYYLYMHSCNKKSEFMKEDMDIDLLIEELTIYSKDDVIRMKYIEENKEEFFRIAKERDLLFSKISKVATKINGIKNSLNNLEGIDPKITIKEYNKLLISKKEELEKEKEELKILLKK